MEADRAVRPIPASTAAHEAGDFDEDVAAADLPQQYEAGSLRSSGFSAGRRWSWSF
jgi:hypothetical protein